MDDLELLQQRANDALIQSRCDRRSLATLAKALYEQSYIITSTSQLIRLVVEELRRRVLTEGADDILSYEDADRILNTFGCKGLNTNGRAMPTYIRQQGKEALLLDGTPVDYALTPQVTKKMLAARREGIERAARRMLEDGEAKRIFEQSTENREFRRPDNIETVQQAEQRRQKELEDTKSALAHPPTPVPENES